MARKVPVLLMERSFKFPEWYSLNVPFPMRTSIAHNLPARAKDMGCPESFLMPRILTPFVRQLVD